MSSDLDRIQASIARCKERIGQIESGQRGVVSEGYRHQDGGRAYENQLHAQRQALERFEAEFLQAMLAEHRWTARDVIERMARCAAPTAPTVEPAPVQIVKVGDVTRGKLQSVLEDNPGNFVPRSKLTELLAKPITTFQELLSK